MDDLGARKKGDLARDESIGIPSCIRQGALECSMGLHDR